MKLTQKDRTTVGIVVAAFFIAMAIFTYSVDKEESASETEKEEVVEKADSISKELKKKMKRPTTRTTSSGNHSKKTHSRNSTSLSAWKT